MVEVLGDAGIIVDNMTGWENKLIELLESPAMRCKYGELAKERAKKYTMKKMINSYNELFEKIKDEK